MEPNHEARFISKEIVDLMSDILEKQTALVRQLMLPGQIKSFDEIKEIGVSEIEADQTEQARAHFIPKSPPIAVSTD